MGRWRWSVLAMLCAALEPSHAQSQDSSRAIADGLELHRAAISEGGQATYLRVDLTKFDVRVLTALVPLDQHGISMTQSLERAARGFFLKDYRTLYDAKAVLSGGYIASFSPPTGLGLVKSNGIIANEFHKSWLTEGLFCSDVGRVQIHEDVNLQEFRDCLQAGPLLLLKGESPRVSGSTQASGYAKLARSVQAQNFVCTSGDNEVVLGITDKIDMPTLAAFLGRSEVGCVDAIRLTGQQTAGLALEAELIGNDQYLFPSVLAVMPRKP